MQPIKEKNENSDYKGDEMGDDIKNIDLSCPTANAAASKIQVRESWIIIYWSYIKMPIGFKFQGPSKL